MSSDVRSAPLARRRRAPAATAGRCGASRDHRAAPERGHMSRAASAADEPATGRAARSTAGPSTLVGRAHAPSPERLTLGSRVAYRSAVERPARAREVSWTRTATASTAAGRASQEGLDGGLGAADRQRHPDARVPRPGPWPPAPGWACACRPCRPSRWRRRPRGGRARSTIASPGTPAQVNVTMWGSRSSGSPATVEPGHEPGKRRRG